MIKQTTRPKDTIWYKLDNAGKIYPAIRNAKDSFVFRISVTLNDIVKPNILNQALLDLSSRFPTMFVKIKKGLFWYYLEVNKKNAQIKPEPAIVNHKIDVNTNNNYFFSVFYYQNRISLETFHSLCDGYSANEFIKALVFRYLQLLKLPVTKDDSVLTIDQAPSNEEAEDSFKKYTNKLKPQRQTPISAFHIKSKKFIFNESRGLITGRLETDKLLEFSKKNNASLTQYLVALLIFTIYETHRGYIKESKPIRVSVPVNMRRFFPSKSLRNFTQYFHTTQFVKDDLTFNEILENVKNQFIEEIKIEKFQGSINANVSAEKNVFVRLTPLFLKKIILGIAGSHLGKRLETATLSNVGTIKMPPSTEPYIDSFEFNLSTASAVVYGVGVGSFNNITTISFLRSIYDTEVEKRFFKHFSEQGLNVKVSSNFWEDNA